MKKINSILIIIFCTYTAVFSQDTLQLKVEGVCGMCQFRIEKAANQVKGVDFALWEAESNLLTVAYNTTDFSVEKLHKRIAGVGHDTEKVKASKAVYESLPDCCKYKDPNNIHNKEKHGQHEANRAKKVQGMIYERTSNGKELPLVGATVQWLGDTNGTATDVEGHFELTASETTDQLIVDYVGFTPDTIALGEETMLAIVLTNNTVLEEVEIAYRKKSTEVSFLNPLKVQLMDEKELLKAACCNLSESFETNPAVEVSFTDAVTGTRQIELLGLAGPYVQTTREFMPDIRGLSALYGFTFTPGTWIESIQLGLGAGSVVNGFESITGQINVELRKPENTDKLYFNLYANELGRLEANAHFSKKINENLSSALLLHTKYQQLERDRNEDGFMDMPLDEHLIVLNRWKYSNQKGLRVQMGIKVSLLDNTSGQLGFDQEEAVDVQNLWGANVNTKRIDGWAKIGKVFPSKPYASMGLQLAGSYHDQSAFFGLRPYNAQQSNVYANFIYQNIIRTTQHTYKTGASFQWDGFEEELSTQTFTRDEVVPGAFFEYTYKYLDQFTAVAGIRGDYHNYYGFFATPRLHLRYAPKPSTVFRASAGRGLKTASIFAENIGIFATNRAFIIEGAQEDLPYGLDAEVAWNIGWNVTQEMPIGERTAFLSLDLYRTWFENQIVVDYEEQPQSIYFYNLEGSSFSNSLQAQLDVELLDGWDVRLAYRFNDVQTDYKSGQLTKPLIARHRAFLNTGYQTKSNWHFDFTLNWEGTKRIPNTSSNPEDFQVDTNSPNFFLANAQVTKNFKKGFSIYVGGENIFNFRQDNPIIDPTNPFGKFFDSSLVWGPIFGRNIYMGLRYRIQE